MATECLIYINNDTEDSPLETSGVDWIEIDELNDFLIFSGGSDMVADGEAIPSDTQLNQAGLLLLTPRVDQTYEKYFLADADANLLRQIHNMGAGNYRYVVGFDFDAETVSEPVLELWDDEDLDSVDITSLGAGNPSSSWFRGITTTNALPGSGWTGSRLAGSSDGHFLWLNDQNGALESADTLYCQMKIIIPSTQLEAGAEVPVFAIKYATV